MCSFKSPYKLATISSEFTPLFEINNSAELNDLAEYVILPFHFGIHLFTGMKYSNAYQAP